MLLSRTKMVSTCNAVSYHPVSEGTREGGIVAEIGKRKRDREREKCVETERERETERES